MFADAAAMQISGANLLIAGQQAQQSRLPAAAQAFREALAVAKAPAQRFEPPSFDAPPAEQPSATPAAPQAARTAPGAKLDIRV